MSVRRGFWRTMLMALPRLAIATLNGIVIATPIVLRLFSTEIRADMRQHSADTVTGGTGILAQIESLGRISQESSSIAHAQWDMRERERQLGLRANERIALEMEKVLDASLAQWYVVPARHRAGPGPPGWPVPCPTAVAAGLIAAERPGTT